MLYRLQILECLETCLIVNIMSQGGKIPIKWTAPEVFELYIVEAVKPALLYIYTHTHSQLLIHVLCRPFISRSTLQPVMCGALGHSCMRYGVWDTNHLKIKQTQRYTVYHYY